MNRKAQIHLEAIIAFFFLTGFLAIMLLAIEKQGKELALASNAFEAEAKAQECAIIVNAVFANTETELKNSSFDCFSSGEFGIKSSAGEKEKSAFSIAREIKTIRTGNKTILEVKTGEHYK